MADELHNDELVPDFTEDTDLTEEVIATATIEELFDGYISTMQEMLDELLEVSVEGNPVRTHITLTLFTEEQLAAAYELRAQLLRNIANRAETFPEQQVSPMAPNLSAGMIGYKQVVNKDEEN